ncbi:MAG: VOC family protein [Beijerinckiaceae bacterium]|nr:VOC family protein [Beijerinckiaceae bacterium]
MMRATTPKLEAFAAPAHVARVTLLVLDLARVARFYADALGLGISTVSDTHVTLTAGDATPLIELHRQAGLKPSGRATPGLFHTAFLLPERRDLAAWLRHAQRLGLAIEGASDHLVSEAIYLSDPEGNGIEIYVDRPRSAWKADGNGVAMATLPLDGASLLAEPQMPGAWRFPDAGRIGHVHLKVGDLAAAEAFYRAELGLEVMARYPGAVFLGWGGYHHHIALNVWASKGATARTPDVAGLAEVGLASEGNPPWTMTGQPERADPAGNRLFLDQASASIS